MKGLLICAGILLVPATARADPCEGRLPERAGEAFAGIVRYVGDGDSLCVGNTANPAAWIPHSQGSRVRGPVPDPWTSGARSRITRSATQA